MHHHHINLKDNPCMNKPMVITCPQEVMSIPLDIYGTISCTHTSSPTQQQLEDCPRIILTYQHDWDPHSIWFPKVSCSEEEEDLFTGIAAICVDALQSRFHETKIDPGLSNTIYNPSFIATQLVSYVIISDANVTNSERINYPDEDAFEVQHQDVPAHRNFTSKKRYLYFNPPDISKRWQIGIGAVINTLKAETQRMLR